MKKIIIGMFLMLLLVTAGCTKQEHPKESTCYTLYYISNDSTKLVTREYWTTTTEQEKLVEELKTELLKTSKKLEYTSPFGNNVALRKWTCKNGRLLLDFEAGYSKLAPDTEVLTRAAIVKTFIQVKGINYISFQVEGVDLEDNMGQLVGAMYADSFIYNEGAQINSFEKITLNLYFANEAGDSLVKTEKTVMYNTNIAMERMILERLIDGPKGSRNYATINPDTKILSVVVKDGVCYVNLSSAFLTQVYSISPEVAIYSVVNSLCEISGIGKVQISVDGDSSIVFREKMPLNAIYEFNRDILDKGMTN